LVGSPSGRDQRARSFSRFYDYHAPRQATHNAIAPREGARHGGHSGGRFGEDQAALGNLAMEGGILRWVDLIGATSQNGHCTRGQCGTVGCRIDTARET
jgi:hypothetical protein